MEARVRPSGEKERDMVDTEGVGVGRLGRAWSRLMLGLERLLLLLLFNNPCRCCGCR